MMLPPKLAKIYLILKTLKYAKAFTLLELCLTLSIITVILVLAIPSWKNHTLDQKAKLTLQQTQQLINFARQAAIAHQQAVSFCSSMTGKFCDQDWSKGLVVFLDPQLQGQPTAQNILEFHSLPQDGSYLKWQAFGKKTYLSFDSNGVLNGQNGTISYCLKQEKFSYGPSLIINHLGHIRLEYQKLPC